MDGRVLSKIADLRRFLRDRFDPDGGQIPKSHFKTAIMVTCAKSRTSIDEYMRIFDAFGVLTEESSSVWTVDFRKMDGVM